MRWLTANPVNDFFVTNGVIRADDRMMYGMTLLQVKAPAESSGPWDYHKAVQKVSAEEIYGPLSQSRCKFVKS